MLRRQIGQARIGAILRAPGQEIGLIGVKFTYTGPAKRIAVGWGIKPSGILDFNDGQYLLGIGYYAFTVIEVPEYVTATPYEVVYPGPVATVKIPEPGTYTSKGNKDAGRPKVDVTVNWGTFHTWVWAADLSRIAADGLMGTPDLLTWEEKNGGYVMLVTTNADVGEIIEPTVEVPEVPIEVVTVISDLTVTYAAA